jgi:dolichol-phosphate mannosyltransferase
MKSKSPLSVSLVIPVYNSSNITVDQLKECEKLMSSLTKNFEIIVCDDCSIDKTAQMLRKNFSSNKYFKLIFNKTNLGISRTIRKLYDLAYNEYVILFSVDGDWNPKDIIALIETAIKTKSDIVVGLRKKNTYTTKRKLISFMYNFLPLVFFGVQTHDAGSIKVFRKKIFQEINLISESIFFEAEFIIKAAKRGYTIRYIPIDFYKKVRNSGEGGNWKLVQESMQDFVQLVIKGL